MLGGRSSAALEREFEQAVRLGCDPFGADAPPTTVEPQRRRTLQQPQQTPQETPPTAATAPELEPLQDQPEPDATVVVPHSLWPTYPCRELGGTGWLATVLSASRTTALVRFTHASTARGARYEDVRLPLTHLRQVKNGHPPNRE
jgi:hypothetical protein